MERNLVPEIKICGITTEEELRWLREEQVEYAGFVLWEKSRRALAMEQAKQLLESAGPGIKKVAVTVSPSVELAMQIQEAGFDILQVHGTLSEEVIEAVHLPVWQAVNLSGTEEFHEVISRWESGAFPGAGRIAAVLADAREYGSGKTFGWEAFSQSGKSEKQKRLLRLFADFRRTLREQQAAFVLAGGLTPENAKRGTAIFTPDILDVSSGVERAGTGGGSRAGKDREKIRRFVRNVRKEGRKAAVQARAKP